MSLKKLIINTLPILLIIAIFSCSNEVMPDLTEKEATAPSLTIKTIINNEISPLVSNSLINVNTSVEFYAEASDVQNEAISYKWYLNDEQLDETSDVLSYVFNNTGQYSLKVIAQTGTEATDAFLEIAVFETSTLIARSIEDGTYVCQFDADDDSENEIFTFIFAGENVELKIDSANYAPDSTCTLKGIWRTKNYDDSSGAGFTIDFLIKEDTVNGNTWHSWMTHNNWFIFDYEGKTYLSPYPLMESEIYDNWPFALNKTYEGNASYSINDESKNWVFKSHLNYQGISNNITVFCGLNKDTIPVVKTISNKIIGWNFEELANGSMHHVKFDNTAYLFLTGEDATIPALLFEKQ